MKKLSWILITSSIFALIFTIVISGRGYTKDDLSMNDYDINTEYFYEILSKKVVQIYTTGDKSVSFGTGFFIDNKKSIVTNYHVVREATNIYILFKDDSYAYRAELVAFDEKNDIAILTSKEDFKYESFELAFDVARHQNVCSCGFSLDYVVAPGKIIDARATYEDNNYIQTNNILKRGNSGGPVINEKGEVIGMVTLGTKSSTYLVPSSKIMNLVYNTMY